MSKLLLLALVASLRQHLTSCVALIALLSVTGRSPVSPGQMVLVLLLAFTANVAVTLGEGVAWALRIRREVVGLRQRLLEERARSGNLN